VTTLKEGNFQEDSSPDESGEVDPIIGYSTLKGGRRPLQWHLQGAWRGNWQP
jgi:hypothetical protein